MECYMIARKEREREREWTWKPRHAVTSKSLPQEILSTRAPPLLSRPLPSRFPSRTWMERSLMSREIDAGGREDRIESWDEAFEMKAGKDERWQ